MKNIIVNWYKMNEIVISQTKTKSALAVGRRLRKHLTGALVTGVRGPLFY